MVCYSSEAWDSRIGSCKKFIPGCGCCELNKVRICLYPGEYENSKLNKNHLLILNEDWFGGKIVTCTRMCTDNDLKPLDCKTYPFFPFFDEKNDLFLKISPRCPLSKDELKQHREKTTMHWKELIEDKKIADWIKTVKLVGCTYKTE